MGFRGLGFRVWGFGGLGFGGLGFGGLGFRTCALGRRRNTEALTIRIGLLYKAPARDTTPKGSM